MALNVSSRIKESTTTTGTGTITLAGAEDGFQSFAVIGNTNTTYYTIVNGDNWEVGTGSYTVSGTTLSRDTVLASSSSGSKITLSGTSDVFCTYPAEKALLLNASDQINGNNVVITANIADNAVNALKLEVSGNGTLGQALTSDADGSMTWSDIDATVASGAIYENSNTIAANYTLTTNKNAMSVGPITINSGVTVTVPSGQNWVVL
tara:strand:+ start:303 stop:923 length:621 start_codon:yes stop_codon:yes gene_type:complete